MRRKKALKPEENGKEEQVEGRRKWDNVRERWEEGQRGRKGEQGTCKEEIRNTWKDAEEEEEDKETDRDRMREGDDQNGRKEKEEGC